MHNILDTEERYKKKDDIKWKMPHLPFELTVV